MVTGDRVTLSGPEADPVVHVAMAAGRERVGYVTLRQGKARDVLVLPRDVVPLVGRGQLDRALFDVTRLVADGFGDADRADVPLLASGLADTAGLTVQRRYTALPLTALREPKGSGAAIERLKAAGPGAKLWLDHHRRRRLPDQLQESLVPATAPPRDPVATGAGVTVAVIDTGIDTTHPDLAGKVVAAASFIEKDPGNGDPSGYGTFTASIIAGSGALNHGAYRGVAPDAQLLDARACGDYDYYCDDSALIAAMEWAVIEHHAPIVSLAVGDYDNFNAASTELDPVEATIEQLSAQYGALFVTPAGDEGEYGDGLLLLPGTAPSALTVGAVNRAGRLAAWSSRGPSVRHDAIKPDLTALGVAVVGAAAPGVPLLGAETDDGYQAISSTVAAVPGVAGAAAVLLQQHPSWTGAELKAALVGAADPDPALTPYEQGAGQLDLARAAAQAVLVEPASLELGVARWPHDDDPILTRTLVYRNDRATALTLSLAPRLALANGDASNHMLQVTPQTLTLAPGARGTVTVTVDTRGDVRDDQYQGEITATGDGVRLVTPIAVARESEAYDLTLHVTDRTGADSDATIAIHPRHPDSPDQVFALSGTATLRLPPDHYAVHAFPADPQLYLTYPDLALAGTTTVELDGRQTRDIAPDLRGVTLSDISVGALLWDQPSAYIVTNVGEGGLYTKHFGPDTRDLWSWATVEAVPAGSPLAEPEIGDYPGVSERYLLAHQEHDHMMTGWQETIRPSQLATVDAHARGSDDGLYDQTIRGAVPSDIGEPDIVLETESIDDYGAGVHHTEHYFGTGMRWWTQQIVVATDPFSYGVSWSIREHDYAPGSHLTEAYNAAPIGPAVASGGQYPGAYRRGDAIQIMGSRFSPRDVPAGRGFSSVTHSRQTLYRNGEIVFDDQLGQIPFMPEVTVDPEAADYRFEVSEGRGTNAFTGEVWTDLSTEVTASWTFRSAHTPDGVDTALPLPTFRFLPALTDDNRAPGRVLILPAQIQRPEGAPVRRITKISVDVSFDDGATWHEVPGAGLGDQWLGVVIQPDTARYASLRAAVDDVDGRHSELSIVHAYKL